MKLSNFQKGNLAEYFVIFLYKICFYKIIAHRFRNFAGEIDIIAQKKDLVVFIEVKSRKESLSYYRDAILSNKQQSRIIKAAEIFLSKKDWNNYNVRFDLVIIRKFNLPMILKNAWGKN